MNIGPAAITAWRDKRAIDKAIKDHDKTGLAVAISLVFTFAVTLLKGTKYESLASFLDPDTLSAAGVLVAGVVAGFGHWAARGAIANTQPVDVAGPPGDAAAPAVAPASAGQVDTGPAHSDDPARDMPLGG